MCRENSPDAHNSYKHAKISNAKPGVDPIVRTPHRSDVIRYVLSMLNFFLSMFVLYNNELGVINIHCNKDLQGWP